MGLYHYKARVYSPTIGRFLQTDPIGYGDGMNIYAYVHNDPVNRTDPLGLDGQDIFVTGMGWCVQHPGLCMAADDVRDLLSRIGGLVGESGGAEIVVKAKRIRKKAQKEPCNPGAVDSFFETGLDVLSVTGDGLAVLGALTGNPVLLGVGKGLNIIGTVGSATLNASQGDGWGVVIDAVSVSAGRAPGATIARRLGGAKWDLGLNAKGQFLNNWRGRRKAQDIATKGLQSQVTAKTFLLRGVQDELAHIEPAFRSNHLALCSVYR